MIPHIKNESDINEAIATLERTKASQKLFLTESFEEKMESLQPANLIRSAAINVMTKPSLRKGLLLSAGSAGAVMVIKKIIGNRLRGRSLLLLALSGAGTMLVKKIIANRTNKTIKI